MIIGKAITAGGSGGIPCILTVFTEEGAVVKATLGNTEISQTVGTSGKTIFELKKEGTWTISATLDGETKSTEVLVEHNVEETLSFFPQEPSGYEELAIITASQTWTAPENGYFQIEVFGASGNGANGHSVYVAGGGGGGGGYSCSRIKMNKDDTIVLTVGGVGAVSSASINSSLETYDTLSVTSGANGSQGPLNSGGAGGAGGVASGGNYANLNGGKGGTGSYAQAGAGGYGGAAGYTGGNVGGAGGNGNSGVGGAGKAGFFKIYRGNTNLT
ncbi:MAG: hypothetical protein J6S23_01725 [Clostridia bacterium]|nr:hypothetical protein [Clostridia bacterium]